MSDILNGLDWHVEKADCIEHLATLPDESVSFSVFSPPFPSVYAYSSSHADIGNSEDLRGDARLHLSFFYRQLFRALKPGRSAVVHVAQIVKMKRAGEMGLFDFRGLNIRLAERVGFSYEYDWCVRKNPQSQALRNKAWELKFQGLETDRAGSRGALPDFLLKFRKPGDNAVKISNKEITRNDWIKWAEHCWDDIQETDTLNVAEGRGEDDTKHICVARGQLVCTYDGHKPIEEVNVGDIVLTHKGRWMPVIAKRCNGIQPAIKTEAQGVPGLVTTPDHLLWARSRYGCNGGISHPRANATENRPAWIKAAESIGSYVNLALPPIQESQYSPEEWWLIGRWLGDGHVDSRGGVHISCAHRELDSLVEHMGDHAGFVHSTDTVKQIRVKDRSGRLRALMKRCGSNCYNKKLPGEALSLNHECSEALLSGYLSADGHFVEEYQRWTASSVSRALLLGMAMVAQRARGVVASVYAGRLPSSTEIDGRHVETLQDWILSIPPKNLSAILLDDGGWKKVRKISDYETAEVWDLQVSEDESFVVEGCAVHNCPLQLEPIRRLVLLFSNPGEIVLSPFAGIGSEGFMSLGGKSPKTGKRIIEPRRFYGIELKDEYYDAALLNCQRAVEQHRECQRDLFTEVA